MNPMELKVAKKAQKLLDKYGQKCPDFEPECETCEQWNRLEDSIKSDTHFAIAVCGPCQKVLISFGGGRFHSCECGKAFIDQERWDGRYVRIGGGAELQFQKCHEHCKIEEDGGTALSLA